MKVLADFFAPLESFHFQNIEGEEPFLQRHFDLLPPNSEHYALKRKYEFVAGRLCAQKALKQVGVENFTVEIGEHREPIWPSDIVGSITHNKSLALCIVSQELRGVGIDIEHIISPERFEKLRTQFISAKEEKSFDIDNRLGTIIFSAKESLFKALYPLVNEYFGFQDAEVVEVSDTYITLELIKDQKQFRSLKGLYRAQYILLKEGYLTLVKVS